jgi:hypothetical protein
MVKLQKHNKESSAHFLALCCILGFGNLPLRSLICIFCACCFHFGYFAIGPACPGMGRLILDGRGGKVTDPRQEVAAKETVPHDILQLFNALLASVEVMSS